MNVETIMNYLATNGVDLVIKLAAAVAIWIIGRWIIAFAMTLVTKAIARGGKLEPTMSRYITSILSGLLTIGLVMGILGYLGVETTSFAALIAGAGLAIGTAWGGLLTHFAAGVFMQILRPFKVGDYVSAGGVEGTVKEMGLFGTTIHTGDNVTTIVGNNKIFSDTIKNFSALPHRRVDVVLKMPATLNPKEAIARLRPIVEKIPHVVPQPAPDIDLLEVLPDGNKICVRPYCHTDHYWQVHFELNRAILETFGASMYPPPPPPAIIHVSK